MQTFRPAAGAELQALVEAAQTLKKANEASSAAQKAADAAKAKLTTWLKEYRQVDLGALPIGELVNIEGVALIKISDMKKFDQAGFQLAEPELFKKWLKSVPVKRFDPQV